MAWCIISPSLLLFCQPLWWNGPHNSQATSTAKNIKNAFDIFWLCWGLKMFIMNRILLSINCDFFCNQAYHWLLLFTFSTLPFPLCHTSLWTSCSFLLALIILAIKCVFLVSDEYINRQIMEHNIHMTLTRFIFLFLMVWVWGSQWEWWVWWEAESSAPSLRLVHSDHVTWTLSSDWLRQTSLGYRESTLWCRSPVDRHTAGQH